MPFQNPIVGGTTLIRPAIKSPNYVPGVSGWSINRDGSAEFNDVTSRGSVHVGSSTRYIEIIVQGAADPVIIFQPDSTTFVNGFMTVVGQNGVLSGEIQLFTPELIGGPGSALAGIILTSADYITDSRIELSADRVFADRYFYALGNSIATVTVNSATAVPGANVTVVSLTKSNLVVGRKYRVTIGWHGVIFGTPVVVPGNRGTMHIAVDGTFATAGCRILGHNANGFSQFGGCIVGFHTATATSHTYAMILQHEAASTAATLGCSAVADSPAFVAVEGWA